MVSVLARIGSAVETGTDMRKIARTVVAVGSFI